MSWINTFGWRKSWHQSADEILKCFFINEKYHIFIQISLRFIPKGPINNMPSMVQIMPWRHSDDNQLSDDSVVYWYIYIWNTQPWRIHTLWTDDAHYNGVIMSVMAFQIVGVSIVYSIIYSGADQRKHQSSTSLAFVQGIHWWPLNSPHKWPVTWKMFPFDDVIIHMSVSEQCGLMTCMAPNHWFTQCYLFVNWTHTQTRSQGISGHWVDLIIQKRWGYYYITTISVSSQKG